MVRPDYAVHAPFAVDGQHVSFNALSMTAVGALDADGPCFFYLFDDRRKLIEERYRKPIGGWIVERDNAHGVDKLKVQKRVFCVIHIYYPPGDVTEGKREYNRGDS